MNDARADALAARSHLAAHGWIPRSAEAFRHLPPPDAALWLGNRDPIPPDPVHAPRDWELGALPAAAANAVDARWLDAADPAQRRELLAGLPLAGDDAAAPFAWAHRALLRQGLRLRVRPAAGGEELYLSVHRRRRDAVEAPLLVLDLEPGARCVLLETHDAADAAIPGGHVQNLQVHVMAGEHASLRHLRMALPRAQDQLAHHVHVRLQAGATYEQALLAGGSGYHLQRTVLDLDHPRALARAGSVLLAADACIDYQVQVHHGARDTTSGIDVLALGSGCAKLVANAYTTIAPGSDDANVRQRLAGVPTRGQPRIVLRPHLEIHHDQVQAAHGATWGALPEDALFHARQRGIAEADAKAMIAMGMGAAVFARALGDADALESSGLATRLAEAIAAHLAGGNREHAHG
ncbi:MAG: SufD family Fe-S cluster assembly protein [Ramlibacter sp.]|nr:SufD family Fe-S cluster assembly protein [Ramlibacter sp.]